MHADEPDLLTVHEVATQLRVDDTTVRRWITSGALAAVTLPHGGKRRAYRVRRSTLDALLAPPGTSMEYPFERKALIPRVRPAPVVRHASRLAY
jgi:excisionase family DNA binding protein